MPPAEYLLPPLAYLLGSVACAIVVSRALRLPDPRAAGSNNPGATNVLRLGGKKAAVAVLVGDMLKGWLPVAAAAALTDRAWLIGATGFAAFLGHLYPLFFRFHGGKGVATAAGVFLGLHFTVGALLVVIWLGVARWSRYASLAALCAAACAPVLVWYLAAAPAFIALAMAIAVLLFWRHRDNIRRLLAGQERKLGRRF